MSEGTTRDVNAALDVPAPRIIERIGYLGPAGTFTEMALLSRPEARTAQAVPYASVDAALLAVRAGEIDAAVVPIENSVEGGVSATLDALAGGDRLVVIGEMLVPITFVLAVRPGVTLAEVKLVSTHSHGWAQVRGWMAEHLPEAGYVASLSTAAAAVDLAARGDQAAYQGAVCAPIAAQQAGLVVLAHDIGDVRGAVTRFVLVAPPGPLPEPTGADKTTLVLFQRSDRPGGLLKLLEQFAVRGVNLTRLESRPTGESLGQYCFSVDIEGHVIEERVAEALMGLHRVCARVRFLGSYPRADRQQGKTPIDHTNEAFEQSRAWLARTLRPPAP